MGKNEQLSRTIAEVWSQKYVVPLYQRNFAWGEEQLEQLLQDLYDHAPKNGEEKDGWDNYYLGSLVTLQRRDGTLEVIDGQQRLTALHIICRKLNIQNTVQLSYDSRPEVEHFFKKLFTEDWVRMLEWSKNADRKKIARLLDAIQIVEDYRLRTVHGELKLSELAKNHPAEYDRFRDYILHNAILICTPLPADTDVASYFEIMNNRGEQLQAHEILKAVLMKMEELPKKQQSLFADIWTGCSQLEIPIQMSLRSLRSQGLFGDNYDHLYIDVLDNKGADIKQEAWKIDDILQEDFHEKFKIEYENTNEEKEYAYRSIIDFPNFLMHTLRLYEKIGRKVDKTQLKTPLNPDAIPLKKPEYIADSWDFVNFMLRVRVLFDRYVIKSQGEDKENDTDLKWTMLRPYRYDNNLKLRNTFSDSSNDGDDDTDADNSRVIKQQSMLQVTFRSQKYKEWLFDLLEWLFINGTDVTAISYKAMSERLDKWINDYYQELRQQWQSKDRDILAAGTDTPHFLFNLIDYLYWVASKNDRSSLRYIGDVRKHNFRFKHYNSVEHHLPQSYENNDGVNVDLIGNLCLVSKSINSSLNKEGPLEKAKVDKNTQPKRRVMYEITNDYNHWGRKEIEAHQQDIEDLLAQCSNLLNVTNE